jgi:hypothetical protein
MIYIISLVMLMVGLISGSVLISMGPNVSAIVEKDLSQKAFNNNELYALQYGDIAARARTVIPDACAAPAIPNDNSYIALDIGPLYSRDGAVITDASVAIHVCQEAVTPTNPNPGVVIRPAIAHTQQNYTDFF